MSALTTPNKSLFISYSRKQTEWSDDLYHAIDEHTTYQRWRDNKIPIASDWWDSICVNIEGCYALVAIITQDYLNSVFCMGELDYALKLNKPVIALVLQDVDYPEQLDQQHLQFARVINLEILQVIIHVQGACTEIMSGYMQDRFSPDIHPRPHLRPQVPIPPQTNSISEEDVQLNEQVSKVQVHGQIPTRDVLTRYNEEKTNNIRLARDLLNQLKQRDDLPIFVDLGEEDKELSIAEERLVEEEQERQRIKKIRQDYEDLEAYVRTTKPQTAVKAIRRFLKAYPDFDAAYNLLEQFTPAKVIQPDPVTEEPPPANIPKGKKTTDTLTEIKPIQPDPVTEEPPPANIPKGKKTTDMLARIKSILPEPFDWVDIPAGYFLYGDDKVKISLPDFSIAKYPITHAQYQVFIDDKKGYHDPRWWKGFAQTQPDQPRDPKRKTANRPRDRVTWYDVMAFCRWLSWRVGGRYGINTPAEWAVRLPTEYEWEKAARGRDGLEYPYGDKFFKSKSNTSESGFGQTTLVTKYPKGASPYGVMDMSGNVWEWCLTDYNHPRKNLEGENLKEDITRVLRGGAFDHIDRHSRSANRHLNVFSGSKDNDGFRVCSSL